MRLVILESPYAGDGSFLDSKDDSSIGINVDYARRCLRDCLNRGESPIASHLLFTQPGVLRDEVPEEREIGISAGLAWINRADATVVYTDLGISRGMQRGIDTAHVAGVAVEYRQLGG